MRTLVYAAALAALLDAEPLMAKPCEVEASDYLKADETLTPDYQADLTYCLVTEAARTGGTVTVGGGTGPVDVPGATFLKLPPELRGYFAKNGFNAVVTGDGLLVPTDAVATRDLIRKMRGMVGAPKTGPVLIAPAPGTMAPMLVRPKAVIGN